MTELSAVNAVVEPKTKDLGDGFIVRRSIPNSKRKMIGPFIFWDHMGPAKISSANPMVVRAHPHIGLSTITYLFSGEILHRDSLGNEQPIRPGEVNWMTAGKGIVHSERSIQGDEPRSLEGIQLWVALPKEAEEVEPSFVHMKESDLPECQHGEATLRLVAGSGLGSSSPLPVYSDLFYFSAQTPAKSSFDYELSPEQEGAIYIVNGTVTIEGSSYYRHHMIVYKQGESIRFHAEEKTNFMLLGGTPFPEGRHIWWNFVASEESAIEHAKKMWRQKEFPSVINETDFIPLPE